MSAVADAYFPPPLDQVLAAAVVLLRKGWHPIPIPWKVKLPAIKGVTGYEGVDLDEQGIYIKFREQNHPQLGSRMPVGIVGVDVDQYDDKDGWDKLEAFRAEHDLPPLPPTLMSTSRPWPSGIRFYRIPADIKFRGNPVANVEMIQRHHRFTMCAPSVHPKTGETYQWIGNDGEPLDEVPPVSSELITDLPWSWVEALRDDRPEMDGRPAASWTNDAALDEMDDRVAHIVASVTEAEPGSRHDTMHAAVCTLWRMDEEGLAGTQRAFDVLQDWFVDEVAADRDRDPAKGRRMAIAEFNRSLQGGLDYIRTRPPRPNPAEEALSIFDQSAWGGAAQSTAQPDDEPWTDPEPIDNVEVPPFPLEVFPAWMQVFCQDVAESIQTPIDLPAMCALGVLSLLGTHRLSLQIKGTYTETANLYLAVGMPPSAGKSPVFRRAFAPITEYQKELRAKAQREIAQHEARRKLAEKALREAEKNGNLVEMADAQLELSELESTEPWPPQLMADDQTPEAFVQLLHRHGRIAIVSTEGDLFDMMDRYSDNRSAQLGPYLKAWAGDAITVNRKGAKEPLIIDRALASVCLTVQPGVLADMGTREDFSVRGLPQRFMYSLPRSLVGGRDYINAPDGDERIYEMWNKRILELAEFLGQGERRLRLSPDAHRMFTSWKQSLEHRRRQNGDLESLAEWTTKCESSVARLAALLWLADGSDGDEVSAAVMSRAITVGRYWITHAKVVLGLWFPEEDHSDAKDILRIIRKKGWTGFTTRDVVRSNNRRYPTSDRVEEAVEVLERKGWVRRTAHPTRPSVLHWTPHPACTAAVEAPAHATHDAPEASSEASEGRSVMPVMHSPKYQIFTPSLPLDTSREENISIPRKRVTGMTVPSEDSSAGNRPPNWFD